MRIIHELFNTLQCGGTLQPYTTKKEDPVATSGYVDLTVVSPEGLGVERDEIHIEGDLQVVYKGLQDLSQIIDTLAQDAVDKGKLDPSWREIKREES